jgi:6-phosphogluconolactonase (cycloisomerase 2 family)
MSNNTSRRSFLQRIVTTLVTTIACGILASSTPAQAQSGYVYTSTNSATGNAVLVFSRAANGELTPLSYHFTGGTGTGAGLGNQGAVLLSPDNRWLFTVNAGSNDISVFQVNAFGLRLIRRVSSGGPRPVSLTMYKNMLYVLNAGVPNNITGFFVDQNAVLTPIPNSTRSLSATDTSPAEVGFDPYGALLVVTERGTQNIDVYAVDANGVAQPGVVGKSVGVTPFGFGFDGQGRLFVTEAAGGADGASSVSSYFVSTYGILPISGSVPTNQTAACWLAVGRTGSLLWTGNAGNANSVSSFSIAKNGIITNNGVVSSGMMGTTDLAVDSTGRFLYVLENRVGAVRGFRTNANGTLTLLGSYGGFGAGFTGLAAR